MAENSDSDTVAVAHLYEKCMHKHDSKQKLLD